MAVLKNASFGEMENFYRQFDKIAKNNVAFNMFLGMSYTSKTTVAKKAN